MKKIKYLVLIVITLMTLTGCFGKSEENKREKIVKQYCDILIKENYDDMLDLAYYPDKMVNDDDMTKIAKEKFVSKMKSMKKTVSTCVPMISKEDDNKVYYKLTINDTDSINIEVDKKTNRVYIEDLYEERTIKTYSSSKVSVNGVELTNPTIDDNKATYKFYAFKNLYYEYLIKNAILEDITINLDESEDFTEISVGFKEEFINNIDKDIKIMFKEIADVWLKNADKNSISKYFINSEDIDKLSNFFQKHWTWTFFNYEFKDYDTNPITFEMGDYINDNEVNITVNVNIIKITTCQAGKICISDGKRITKKEEKDNLVAKIVLVKQDNTWIIKNVE